MPVARLLLITLGLTLSTARADIPRTEVQDIRPLLFAALASTNGEAHGVLAGELGQTFTRQFKSATPVYIDVTTERRLRQAGCSRLKVLVWQDGVLLPGKTSPERQTVEIGINFCRNGAPPASPS